MAIHVVFAAMALGMAIYGVLALRSGAVVMHHLSITRSADPQAFKMSIGFIWLFVAILAVAAIVARTSN